MESRRGERGEENEGGGMSRVEQVSQFGEVDQCAQSGRMWQRARSGTARLPRDWLACKVCAIHEERLTMVYKARLHERSEHRREKKKRCVRREGRSFKEHILGCVGEGMPECAYVWECLQCRLHGDARLVHSTPLLFQPFLCPAITASSSFSGTVKVSPT